MKLFFEILNPSIEIGKDRMPTPRDPRWILLVDNGDYSSLSRHREPDAEDIAGAERALRQASRAGWLAVMSHSAYEATIPEIVMVRQLCDPEISFDEAVQLFQSRLRQAPIGGSGR